ncbi:hypothetical protein GCM10010214_26980 [Streptomyces abikoensis]|nr:hypothetical protein GCM10010214_26980 [Streptomyces abikoensis]
MGTAYGSRRPAGAPPATAAPARRAARRSGRPGPFGPQNLMLLTMAVTLDVNWWMVGPTEELAR